MNLQELSILHGWEENDLLLSKQTSVVYREFKEGVVILSDMGAYYILSSFHKDDYYTLDMWRTIRSILINFRDKDILVGFSSNEERLLRASEKYNYILEHKGLVLFPRQEKDKDE